MNRVIVALLFTAAPMLALDGHQTRDAPARPIAGSAVIGGIVTGDEPSGAPIRRVVLTLSRGSMAEQTVSDDQGRFVFAELPAGRYTLLAEKAGFVRTFFGGKRPGRGPGTPIALADGQRLANLSIKISRGAVIAGRALDEQGNPLASAQVHAVQPLIVNGERRLVDPPSPVQYATTDDKGRYRLFGLPPGEYSVFASGSAGMVSGVAETTAADVDAALRESQQAGIAAARAVTPPERSMVTRAGSYFPGVADAASSEVFTLATGEERSGVDVVVPLVRAGVVEGTITGPDGPPPTVTILISIVDARRKSLWASPGFLRPLDAEGHFRTPVLPASDYTFVGRAMTSTGVVPTAGVDMLWAETTVTVDRATVPGVVIQFQKGLTVSGHAVFDGTAPASAGLRLGIAPVDIVPGSVSSRMGTPLAADGAFTFAGLAPGKYLVSAQGAGAWSLRSAILNGRDTLDQPLEVRRGENLEGLTVTFTDRPTELAGTLFDQLGRPSPEYSVLVFSTDRSHWTNAPRRISGAIKLGSDGKYKVTGLPPGEYYIAALVDVEPSQLNDPSFLEMLIPASIKVSLGEGEKKVQDLRLGG